MSARDPGVPNWLDTEGRPDGMISYRIVGASEGPALVSRRVPLAELRAALPADVPVIDESMRRDQIARRRAAVMRRFRV